ncbi:MAG: hypothetical protein JWL65_804 [Gammaproteobacteria bacterium]|nr:hypothetical protein [Gammaproteobacteria bacterium]
MKGQILIDNWTLQNAGELLTGTRVNKTAQEHITSAESPSVQYTSVLQDIVAMACVCQVVQTVVFADRLVTDADYSSSWSDLPPITMLARNEILTAKLFKAAEATWAPRREWMADALCESPAIRAQHERNKSDYAATQQSSDPMLAQVLWGAAGLLARAEFARIPYVPHPLRERLLMRSRFFAKGGDARATLMSFIEGEQLKLYRAAECEGLYGAMRLPPVIVEVLQAASTLQDFLPAALELRGKYRELRQWLGEFQAALDGEDLNEVLARRKLLLSVSKKIDRLAGDKGAGNATLQLGAHFPNLTLNVGGLVDQLRHRFGIRAQINRLILLPPGKSAFRHFVKLLEPEADAALEAAFHAFQTRD